MLSLAPAFAADPFDNLRARLAGFAGYLRANGFGVGGGDAAHVLDAARRVDVFEPSMLRWSLKALLCGRGDEWRRFDALFDAYFLPPNRKVFAQAPAAASHEHEDEGGAQGERASREAALASADFASLDDAGERVEIEALMRRFARRLKLLRLRREARARRGRRLDLAATIRRSVATGGMPLDLAWREPRRVRPRLVLLVDVSRSMSAYSFFHLRLARALCAELADVHAFVFHTRLTDVGDALRDADPWRSQERLHLISGGWAGGTRIGECLRDFNAAHARLLHSRTGVIVVSDGYDTGDPAVLAHALAAMRRRARRIVWLNPLLERADYAPESAAMQAALPHLDLFAAGASLAGIERVLPKVVEALR
jgi:uncharacterized protein with von Willebrand factor type A (vWA) domain